MTARLRTRSAVDVERATVTSEKVCYQQLCPGEPLLVSNTVEKQIAALMTRAFVTLIAMCLAAQGGAQESSQAGSNKAGGAPAASYEVYSAVLSQRYSSWFKAHRPLRIAALTKAIPAGAITNDCRAQVQQDQQEVQVLSSLLAANRQRQRLQKKLTVPGAYFRLLLAHFKILIDE